MTEPERRQARRTPQDIARLGDAALLSELTLTFEELNVAEEELKAQNEELQRAQATLIRERERYRELFEHAPVAYLATDSNGTISDANRAAQILLQYRATGLRGKPLMVFARGVSRRRLRAAIIAAHAGTESATATMNLTGRAGRVRRVEATVSVVRGLRGEPVGLRWLLVDRTRKLQRERSRRARAAELERLVIERTAELDRARELKDELIATVSHEFRTGLSAIGGYAELLQLGVRGPMLEAQMGDVRRIHHAYEHLTRIVNDLLNYSKLASGHVDLDINDVPLIDVLSGLSDLVAPQAARKRLTVRVSCVDRTVIVRADPDRARQAIVNLLGNAVKFTPPGGHIAVTCRETAESVAIDVTDTGVGIPQDRMDAIFQPFVRLRTNGESGTGLGLSISRDLARAMGGDLTVTSSPGQGSCFTLHLPRSTRLADELTQG